MLGLFTDSGTFNEREYISRRAASFWTAFTVPATGTYTVSGQYFVNPAVFDKLVSMVPDLQRSERVPAERPKKKESTLPKHWRAKPAYPGAKC